VLVLVPAAAAPAGVPEDDPLVVRLLVVQLHAQPPPDVVGAVVGRGGGGVGGGGDSPGRREGAWVGRGVRGKVHGYVWLCVNVLLWACLAGLLGCGAAPRAPVDGLWGECLWARVSLVDGACAERI
jgi:hypothetical protein